jgi:glycosyltransferase involved in cell wall biosynthesis
VSVIIPARNAAPWIRDAIRSIAAQTLSACEIIVIDDASTDDTCSLVRQMQSNSPGLILLQNPHPLGAGATRNVGIGRATGDWLAFLDADDWFAPERLQRLTELGEARGANIVADNQYFTHGPEKAPFRTLIATGAGNLKTVDLEGFLRHDRVVAIGNLGLLKPIIRRNFLQPAGPRYDEDPAMKFGEDSLFYMSCLISGEKILLTDEALYFFRQHSASLTHNMTVASVRVLVAKSRALLVGPGADPDTGLAQAIAQTIADQDDIVAYFELVELVRARRWLMALRRLMSSRQRRLFLVRRGVQGLAGRLSQIVPQGSLSKRI